MSAGIVYPFDSVPADVIADFFEQVRVIAAKQISQDRER